MLDLCTGTADLAIAARARAAGGGARRRRRLRRRDAARRPREARGADGSAIASRWSAATRRGFPLADASVDAVTIAFGIRNVEQTARGLRRDAPRAAPGGRLAILEFAIPTTPGVRAALPLVFQSRAAADRPRRLAAQRRVRLPAGVGRRVRVARRVRENSATGGFARRFGRPLTFGIVFLYTARGSGQASDCS